MTKKIGRFKPFGTLGTPQVSNSRLPCPNLFSGGENYHGPYEFISLEALNRSADLVEEIIKVYERKGK